MSLKTQIADWMSGCLTKLEQKGEISPEQSESGKEGGATKRFFFRSCATLVDAAYTFFFSSSEKTSGSVHVRDCNDFKRMMIAVIYALIPCTIFGIYNIGYQANLLAGGPGGWHGAILNWINGVAPALGVFSSSNFLGCFVYGLVYYLPIYITTMIVGIGIEVVFAAINRHEVNEGFFVTGFIFPLICPPTIPLWQVALAIAFGTVVGKEIFGGTGRNIFNPALLSRAFLFFAYAGQISGDSVWTAVDGVSKATPLALASQGVDGLVCGNYTWWNAFLGLIPGSIGETSTLCCLIGGVYLMAVGVASWRIGVSMFVGGMGLAWLLQFCSPEFAEAHRAVTLGPCWHFVLGGFALGMFFMATDPVTAAQTTKGQYVYGFLIGALVIVVRVFNPAYPEGVMLVILFGNCLAPLIDHVFVEANIRRRMKRLQAK